MKFNTQLRRKKVVFNHEGEAAYTLKPHLELYTAVVTSTLSNSYYETQNERMKRIQELVELCDPTFVGKLAIYARTSMNLRSIPLYIACLLAQRAAGTNLVSNVIERIVLRADEITELLACYAMVNNRSGEKQLGKLSKQVQKGLAAAFNSFDEYQFAKYNRKGNITLRDALFLVHPKAKNEQQQAVFDKIVNNTLATPYTWETELSAMGQRLPADEAERTIAERETWESLIESGRLGYMALLRNLRNIIRADVSQAHIAMVCAVLANPEEVAQSKQFPFRFLSAYRQLVEWQSQNTQPFLVSLFKRTRALKFNAVRVVLEALECAVMASAANIRGFDINTRVLIACDVSGSMFVPISQHSTVKNYDVGLMLGMLLRSTCAHAEIGIFGDTWKTLPVPTTSILRNVDAFIKREGEVGYSTNGYLVLEDLCERRAVKDKIMLFTDCQLWNSNGDGAHLQLAWTRYKSTVAPNAKLYLFDLAGHGQAPLSMGQKDVYMIAGWSDKIFDVMSAIEDGDKALSFVQAIELS